MFNLFSALSADYTGVSSGYLQTLLEMRKRELFSGVISVQNSTTERMVLFLTEGTISLVYQLNDKLWRNIPRAGWPLELSRFGGQVHVRVLSQEAMRIFRLFLDVSGGETNTFISVPAAQIPDRLAEWQGLDIFSLVHVRCQAYDALLVVSPQAAGWSEALLMSPDGVQTGAAVLSQIKSWGEQGCQLTRLATDFSSDSGREFVLRIAFGQLVEKMLKRYQELAGRFLVVNLDEEINAFSSQHGWSVSFAGTTLTHTEFFRDASAAGQVYKLIVDRAKAEMTRVIGSQIVDRVVEEALAGVSLSAKELLQQYVFLRIPVTLEAEVKQ